MSSLNRKLRRSLLVGSLMSLGILGVVSASTPAQGTAEPQGPLPIIEADRTLAPGDTSKGADNFYKSNKVTGTAVTFTNSYGMKVAGNLFIPKSIKQGERLPAIVVGHPMGAVKEQSATLYAQKLADQGFVTLAIDLSFWGHSEGEPRNSVSPDIYADDFSAAVDYLDTLAAVDRNKIGVLGICGSGSFVISAAKIDSRMKAIATVSMYDMGAAVRDGLHHSTTLQQRMNLVKEASAQRDVEYAGGSKVYTSGTPDSEAEVTNPIGAEFYDFYRTARGSVGNIRNHTTHPTLTTFVKFMNFYPFNDMDLLGNRPLLIIAGADAHSREFSEDAYAKATGPKELYIIPNAGHVDLYDRTNLIPFDKLGAFFKNNLK